MLELGKEYKIVTLEEDLEGLGEVQRHHCKVVEIAWPVVRVRLDHGRLHDRQFVLATLRACRTLRLKGGVKYASPRKSPSAPAPHRR